MKKFWIYFLIPTLFIACSGGSDQNTAPNTIDNYNRTVLLENLTDNIIIPRYDNLVSQTNQLNTLAANFTTDQSAENFQLLKNAWAQTYIAWQYVEMFNIGKAQEINYIQSMNTYPCNPTQIEINIETLSYNLDDANYQSWASQGMPALDYMFYGLDSDTNNIITKYTGSEGEKYLTYLNNLIDQIDQNTNTVYNDWQTNRNSFISLDGNTATSSLNQLTNDFIYYYEKGLRANKIGIPSGKWNNYIIYPIGVEAYYKRNISKKLALASLKGCQQFFLGEKFINETSDTGIFGESYVNYLEHINDNNDLSNQIISTLDNAYMALNDLEDNFVSQLENNNNLMLEAYDALQAGVVLLKTEMLASLSITVDYQDADGD